MKNLRALLGERKDECHECPEAVPVLVCHDAAIVECAIEQAADAKAWLKKATIERMEAVLNDTGVLPVPVEARIAKSWGEGD